MRSRFLKAEAAKMTGWDIDLNDKETIVNATLMHFKEMEFQSSMKLNNFPPSRSFMTAKKDIEASQVFQIIREMPKGAALHIHEMSLSNITWVVKNLTYLPDLYFCKINNTAKKIPNSIHFNFSTSTPPPNLDCTENWKLVSEARKENQEEFDEMLMQTLSMVVDDPIKAYPNGNASWAKFQAALSAVGDLLFTSTAFDSYFNQAFTEFEDDNVQYMEIRTLLSPIRHMDGSVSSQLDTMKAFQDFIHRYKITHPDFYDAKIIYTSLRFVSEDKVKDAVSLAMDLIKKFPDTMIGFDLVGEEDVGYSLNKFINQLLLPVNQNVKLPYFFHAGETDWQGTSIDENLIDAILLNTSRIGHGFAILKHPGVLDELKKRDIAIEVNPISNQVLKLVDDLRNHPATYLLANDFPVVISSDDPVIWGAKGLSYDFYEAFMALGGERADLRTLKKLALNSIKYSALSDNHKMELTQLWQKKWDMFLDQFLEKHKKYTQFKSTRNYH
ncbi:adenosine deaminase 2-like isoform X2 [Anneissia japonica]|nr:adenosine deaminase 2-like isoform X2 [Anneissia japonica]XP_033095575.1 adenosine deaminase 2-like isoform X2 [Anneissia japonica]